MPDINTTNAVLVIADDFTGANDVGVMLAKHGAQAQVLFNCAQLRHTRQSDVVILNTDSRALPAQQAAQRIAEAMDAWQSTHQQCWFFKKIDSTLRGNIGAELEATLQATGLPLAIVAPAYPALQRKVRQGICWVNDVPLTDSEFASDPKTPVTSAQISTIIAQQSTLPCAELSLSEIRHGNLPSYFNQLIKNGIRVVIADSETQDDLLRIVTAARSLSQHPLLVGSAGLSAAFAETSTFRVRSTAHPLLAVVGSMSEIAQQQLAYAAAHKPITLIDIEVSALLQQQSVDHYVDSVLNALQHHQHCVVRTCQNNQQRDSIAALCQHQGISRQQLGDSICLFLGVLVRKIIGQQPPIGGLYLSGGDVAIAVACALGAESFQVQGQVADCVPWGKLINSMTQDTPVMTKAGGFGTKTTFFDVLNFIEEKWRE
jgi:uncharacterized protein YgbK (DUF1537 family)